MDKSTYEVLYPPLVSKVHDAAEVAQQNKVLEGLGAKRVPRADLEASGLTDLPPGAKIMAFKPAEVSPENAGALREMAGPQHREAREQAWARMLELEQDKGAVQERAADKVGAPKNDAGSYSRASILENGTQIFPLKAEAGDLKSMLEAAGLDKARAYNKATGETFISPEVAEKAPAVFAAVMERFGEHRREAWAAQPEIAALADRAKGNAKDKGAVREYAATTASRWNIPEPLFVADSRKAELTVMLGLKDIDSRVLDARVALAEEAITKNAPLHDYGSVIRELRGRDPVKGKAEMLQEGHKVGAALGAKELERRGYEREFDGTKGKVPSAAQMKEIFGEQAARPARTQGASKAPAAPAAQAGATAKPRTAGGRTARRPAAPAR